MACFNTCHPDILQTYAAAEIQQPIYTKPPLRRAPVFCPERFFTCSSTLSYGVFASSLYSWGVEGCVYNIILKFYFVLQLNSCVYSLCISLFHIYSITYFVRRVCIHVHVCVFDMPCVYIAVPYNQRLWIKPFL